MPDLKDVRPRPRVAYRTLQVRGSFGKPLIFCGFGPQGFLVYELEYGAPDPGSETRGSFSAPGGAVEGIDPISLS